MVQTMVWPKPWFVPRVKPWFGTPKPWFGPSRGLGEGAAGVGSQTPFVHLLVWPEAQPGRRRRGAGARPPLERVERRAPRPRSWPGACAPGGRSACLTCLQGGWRATDACMVASRRARARVQYQKVDRLYCPQHVHFSRRKLLRLAADPTSQQTPLSVARGAGQERHGSRGRRVASVGSWA